MFFSIKNRPSQGLGRYLGSPCGSRHGLPTVAGARLIVITNFGPIGRSPEVSHGINKTVFITKHADERVNIYRDRARSRVTVAVVVSDL